MRPIHKTLWRREMVHTDVIKIVSANPNKFEEVFDDLENLEASCDMVADSSFDHLEKNVNVMINSLLKFKTSKFELLAESISNYRSTGFEVLGNPDNLDITSEQKK